MTINDDVKARLEAARSAGSGGNNGKPGQSAPPPEASQQQQTTKRSANPNDRANKPKSSVIQLVSGGLHYIFSHRGYFWFGLTIGASMFSVNLWFYHDLFGVVAGWTGFQQWFGAAIVSIGTTIFEVTPTLWNRNAKTSLEMIFSAGSKPQSLPELNPAIVGDAQQLTDNYKNSERNARKFFGSARWVAIALESFLGFVFIGSVGAGLRGLFKLVFFLFSIFGTEWGITMAIRAAQWELPPQVRQQFAALWGNNGQPLTLKKPQ